MFDEHLTNRISARRDVLVYAPNSEKVKEVILLENYKKK